MNQFNNQYDNNQYSLFSIIRIAGMFIPCTTCLHILLAYPCLYYYLLVHSIRSLHILLFFIFLPIFMYILCVCVTYNCTVHWPDLHFTTDYILYIEYVTNKTLNWMMLTFTLRYRDIPIELISLWKMWFKEQQIKHHTLDLSFYNVTLL